MKTLKESNTYLVEKKYSNVVDCITILIITKKAYQIRWNTSESPITWEFKENFNNKYFLIENITEKMTNKLDYTKLNLDFTKLNTGPTSIQYKQCPICQGIGTLPSSNTTTGTKICPQCFGSKQTIEKVEISQK